MSAQAKGKMKWLDLDKIEVGERFRVDYGNLEELKTSITEKGILQPISVSSDGQLLAGGRRYRACYELGLKAIPALIRDNVDEIDAREVELMENVFRKDFTWSERAKLTAEIDNLYKAKDPNWSGRKTAGLLERSVGIISEDLKLAAYIEVMPELANEKTADDARKVVKKLEESVLTNELVRRQKEKVNATPTGHTTFDPERNIKDLIRRADTSYQISDVFTGMAKLRTNGHINFIECDPPYGIDLGSQKGSKDSAGNNVDSYQEVPEDEYENFLDKLTKELFRIANKDAWMVFWFGPSWHDIVLSKLKDAGWTVDDIPAIWVKPNGQTLQPNVNLARMYEPFFVCRKGRPALAKPGTGNVFSVPPVKPNLKYHPTERPVYLIKDILQAFTLPADTVFVPFLGSGATIRAALIEGMSAFGFDINNEYKPKFLLKVEHEARVWMEYTERKKNGEDVEEPGNN